MKLLNTKRVYEFVTRYERPEEVFNSTEIAHPKHSGMRRSISRAETVISDVAMGYAYNKATEATKVTRIHAGLGLGKSCEAGKGSSSNRQRSSPFKSRHRHGGKDQQLCIDCEAGLNVVFN